MFSSTIIGLKLLPTTTLHHKHTGQIIINNRLTDIRAVRANVESGLALKPDASVVIAASRLSDAGLLVRVVDQARVAGAGQVSLVALAGE